MAFDYDRKVLLLKSQNKSNPSNEDILIFNLSYLESLELKKEGSKDNKDTKSLPELNIQKLEQRTKTAILERTALIKAFEAGVSPEGIALFQALTKTFGKNVSWNNQSIVVSNEVSVHPPYRSESCMGEKGKQATALNYVRQLVDNFWNKEGQRTRSSPVNQPASSNPLNNGSPSQQAQVSTQPPTKVVNSAPQSHGPSQGSNQYKQQSQTNTNQSASGGGKQSTKGLHNSPTGGPSGKGKGGGGGKNISKNGSIDK